MATYGDHDQRRLDQQSGAAMDRAQRLSTARLIAAAPELLAALKALMPEGWGDDDTMDHIPGVKQARAAIAKATGKTIDAPPCSHCGKPATYSGPCGVGGCPLGADL